MSGSVVLVVDTVVQTAERVSHALAGTRFTVRAVRDAAEAEEVLKHDVVVAVLAAINLPRGNAYDFARHVRGQHPAAAVILVSGGFDVFNAERAAEVGAVRLSRPFTVDAVRRQLEAALGPLTGEDDVLDAGLTLEPLTEVEVDAPSPEPATLAFEALASVGDERLASFLPRDWRALPPVAVDPSVVGPAMERAILAVLPQVVEAVLNKAMSSSPAFREMVEVAVEDALREELPAIVRQVVRQRMAEIERGDG